MSFLFETISIPFWFIVFIIGSASILWIRWYKIFHKKFIITGVLQKKIKQAKTVTETKMDVLKKATDNWNANNETSDFSKKQSKKRKVAKKDIDPVKKNNIRMVIRILADGGETGVLPKSISDKASINSVETNSALTYLTEKKYIEAINSTSGEKYYLTELGKQYCINKKYI
jgi:hypothetical protein